VVLVAGGVGGVVGGVVVLVGGVVVAVVVPVEGVEQLTTPELIMSEYLVLPFAIADSWYWYDLPDEIFESA
jgi:hypothetical protein